MAWARVLEVLIVIKTRDGPLWRDLTWIIRAMAPALRRFGTPC